jgi:CAAX protease family protein
LLARVVKWRVAGRYYVFAVVYMAVIELLAALIQRALTGAWPTFGRESLFLMFGAIPVSTWVQAGEELGWRGYALPRLAKPLGLGGASVFLGVIWAIWHLPLFFLEGSPSKGHSFPLYLLHVVSVSVAMGWLYWKSDGSLLLTMLMHASVNNTIGIVPLATRPTPNALSFQASPVAWTAIGLSSMIAVVLLYRMRGARITESLTARPTRSTGSPPAAGDHRA